MGAQYRDIKRTGRIISKMPLNLRTFSLSTKEIVQKALTLFTVRLRRSLNYEVLKKMVRTLKL
jgi:hypothetical protein